VFYCVVWYIDDDSTASDSFVTKIDTITATIVNKFNNGNQIEKEFALTLSKRLQNLPENAKYRVIGRLEEMLIGRKVDKARKSAKASFEAIESVIHAKKKQKYLKVALWYSSYSSDELHMMNTTTPIVRFML
jgi:hypothetical protein